MTERLYFHFSLSCIGEGNGNPLQCSCLENPRDGGAWWASVYGVAQSQTQLKRLSSSSRDCLKKIGDIKGTFDERMGTIKDRNSKDLTEAKFKKRWQEYTEELNKKGLNDLDSHSSVVTHLEPDILEHEVNWVLGSVTTTKASGGERISAEVFNQATLGAGEMETNQIQFRPSRNSQSSGRGPPYPSEDRGDWAERQGSAF